ncbi:MAG: hypothetical protein ACMUIE_02800 [Thermoplasmatota archaeon]
MGDLLTIRLPDYEKDALDFSSHLSEMPVSKVILPFISEGVKVSLGAVLIQRIDRSYVYGRRNHEQFVELMMSIVSSTNPGSAVGMMENTHERVPKIIWDFFDLLEETRAVGRINTALEEVALTPDASFITPENLRSLCYSIGDSYLMHGGSLESMNYQLANEIFFKRMLYLLYRCNATGTAKSLSTQWYAHQDMISRLANEMNDRYSEKSKSRPVEAIVVTGSKKKRGRPPKRKKKALPPAPQVMAKEIK